MYWKIRWEPSISPSSENMNIAIFKETRLRSSKLDKSSKEWTGTWRDDHPSFKEGPLPENEITGQLYMGDTWRSDPIHVNHFQKYHRFYRNTRISSRKEGERIVFGKPLIGHEFDEDVNNGFRPPGLMRLSETVLENAMKLLDTGRVEQRCFVRCGARGCQLALFCFVFGPWDWGVF